MQFWNWKRKRQREADETFDQILEALKLVHTKLVMNEKDIDMLKLKWNDKLFKKKLKEAPEEEEESVDQKKTLSSDGFDDIRKIRKDLNDEKIGI